MDGLRAACIGMVLFSHLIGTVGFPLEPNRFEGFTLLGVRTFFVLSGFLITTILLNERRRTGTISFSRFYFRRALRIFPVCYLYLIFLLVAQRNGLFQLHRWDSLAFATFTANYHHDRSWYAGHVWSLGVEEQFYLLWPFALRFLSERGLRRLSWAVIVSAPILRILLYRYAPSFRAGIDETFPTTADILATGCLLALLRDQLAHNERYLAILRGRSFWLIPLAVVAVSLPPSPGFTFLIGETLMNIGLAVTIDRLTRFPGSFSGRLLNSAPLVTIGLASYSIFMWQQPFLNRMATSRISHFPLNLALALLAGLVSYKLIEVPIGQLRRRWERSWLTQRDQRARPRQQDALE